MKLSTIVFWFAELCFLIPITYAQVTQDWMARTDSVTAVDVAVDKIGNVYVAGGIYRGVNGFNISLSKYDPDGNQQWMSEYNGIGNDLDYPSAIAIDTIGNIFVTGYSFRGPALLNYEILTIKYNSDGDTLWTRHYNSPGILDDRAFALAVDTAGNAYVGGYLKNTSLGNVYGEDYITIKYGPDGTQIWAAQLDLVVQASVTALTVDRNENVYVTGLGQHPSSASSEYVTVKYNAAGNTLWVSSYDGPGNESDKANAIALDDSGNVYVTGESIGANGWYDYLTLKYDGAGVEQWVRRYDGPANEDDKAIGIAVDKNYNVYVTGQANVVSGSLGKDFATIKYNTAGDFSWVTFFNGTGNSIDKPADIVIDSINNICVTGSSYSLRPNFTQDLDYVTIMYDSNGDSVWVQRYNAADLDDQPVAIAVDRFNNVYVTGSSQDSFTSGGSATIKYIQEPTDVNQIAAGQPEEYLLFQNYPNPFNPSTVISYQLPVSSDVKLKIYDVLGNEVATLVDEYKSAGKYEVEFNSPSSPSRSGSALTSGVYFYQLLVSALQSKDGKAENFIETKKMILMK